MQRCSTCPFWVAIPEMKKAGSAWRKCDRVEIQGSMALAGDRSVGVSLLNGRLVTHETFGCTQHPGNK
jgi:hypothetical protein